MSDLNVSRGIHGRRIASGPSSLQRDFRTTAAAVHRANGPFAGLLESSVVEADLSLAAVDCAPQVAAALTDPEAILDRAERDALTRTSGYFPNGLPELRAAIAGHLTGRLGLPADTSQVIVTTGGQQALDLLIRSEVLPGQPVAVEDPTFPGVLDALHRAGARVIGMPAGHGPDPERLEHVVRTHSPAMVYLIPTHHNPTGLVMRAEHRHRMVRLAAAHPDTLFVDDMTLAELTLADGPRRPPLAALAPRQANLVSVGSLSKVYWGGLRSGWIRASGALIARLAAAKAAADLGSTAFQQAIVAALLRGPHEDIVKWRGEWLRSRYDALADALRCCLPGWTWPEPEGGLSLWVRLPGQVDSSVFAQAALRRGVALVPGRLLSASGAGTSGKRKAPQLIAVLVRRGHREPELGGRRVPVGQQQRAVRRVGPGAGRHPGAVHRGRVRVQPGQEVVDLVVAGQPGRDQPLLQPARPRGGRQVIMACQGRTPTGRRSRCGHRSPTGRRRKSGPRNRSRPAASRCRGRCRRAPASGRGPR